MESKFLDQDVDVVSLANKGIVIGCFVGRNYNKILMETGKLTDNIRVTKMDSDLVLTECFSRRILRFITSPIDLIHSERVSSSTSSFLAHCLAYQDRQFTLTDPGNSARWVNFRTLSVTLCSEHTFMNETIQKCCYLSCHWCRLSLASPHDLVNMIGFFHD